MNKDQKHENLVRLSAAYNAGYITHTEYFKRSEAVHKAFYDTQYGALDLSDIPA